MGRSVIGCALVWEGILEKLVEFRLWVEIISSYMPVTVELASRIDVIRSDTRVHTGQFKKIVRFKWKDGRKAAFLSVVNCACRD